MDPSFHELDPKILEVRIDRHTMQLLFTPRQVIHEVLQTMDVVHVNHILSLRNEEAQKTLDYMQNVSSPRHTNNILSMHPRTET